MVGNLAGAVGYLACSGGDFVARRVDRVLNGCDGRFVYLPNVRHLFPLISEEDLEYVSIETRKVRGLRDDEFANFLEVLGRRPPRM